MKSALTTLAALGIFAICLGTGSAAQPSPDFVPSHATLLLHAAKVVAGICGLDIVIRFVVEFAQRASGRTSPASDLSAVPKPAGRRPLPHRYSRRTASRHDFRRPGILRGKARPLKVLEIIS